MPGHHASARPTPVMEQAMPSPWDLQVSFAPEALPSSTGSGPTLHPRSGHRSRNLFHDPGELGCCATA